MAYDMTGEQRGRLPVGMQKWDPLCRFCNEPISWYEVTLATGEKKAIPMKPYTFIAHSNVCRTQEHKWPKLIWQNETAKPPIELSVKEVDALLTRLEKLTSLLRNFGANLSKITTSAVMGAAELDQLQLNLRKMLQGDIVSKNGGDLHGQDIY